MARSISAISAGVAATSADYVLLLRTSELTGSSADYTTLSDGSWVPIIMEPSVAIGPELDWRGGLATWSGIQVQLAQSYDSWTGTATDNTFEAWKDLFTWEETDTTDQFVQHLLNRNAAVDIYLGAKTQASSWSTQITKVYTGFVRDVMQSDHGPLVLDIGPKREAYLDNTFLRILGHELAGEENYDARSAINNPPPFNEDHRGRGVPILYGALDHALAVSPHTTPTDDDSSLGRHGLILVFSDINYDCYTTTTPVLYAGSTKSGKPLTLQRLDANGDVQYRVLTGGNGDFFGSTTDAEGGGYIVGFTDDTDSSGEFGPRNGYMISTRTLPLEHITAAARAAAGFTTSGWLLNQDDTVSFDGTNFQDNPPTVPNNFVQLQTRADDEVTAECFELYLRFKLTTSASVTWTVRLYDHKALGGALQDIGSSPTGTSINNWTGAGSATAYGWSIASGTTMSTAPQFGVSFRLDPNTTGFNHSWFGGIAEMWFHLPWDSYIGRIYGDVTGVNNATYLRNSVNYLYNPAEVFAHFVNDVAPNGSAVSGTNWTDASDAMDADDIRVDFQLTDPDETVGDVLETLASQTMSWIVPTDAGQEQMIYRPSVTGSNTQAAAPFNSSNIIKGSFRWSLTPRDDIYRGCVVNYKWSALEGRYRAQKIVGASDSTYATNVFTFASTYTGYCDDIAQNNARQLIVDAKYIQDDDTAERLAKWLTLLHGTRRQVIEFETFASAAQYTPGDLIYVDMPQIRAYASGDSLSYAAAGIGLTSTTTIASNSTTYAPSADTLHKGFGAVHHQDLLVIESGAYAGTYRLDSATSGSGSFAAFTLDAYSATFGAAPYTISAPWRVLPGFDVLSAQIVYDASGPRVRIKAVEHPVLLPRALDL